MTEEKTAKIRELNDALRAGRGSGSIIIAGSMANADVDEISAAAKQVQEFTAFEEGNDPHGEHDFGAFQIGDQKYYWKIDYYRDRNMLTGSDDPADPKVTHRVLTIFYAEDY
ncbi:DUF3768 domain-containing protein [Pararhizobium qamdonense]|uniref:DUF3768 domain-containing protein n=1 Tax=Pararhizobium qamdonense TaxID=3031126 RepID=UPI0023E2CE19|nr:DUF3768 domain-containing protein [Pararhizobium qamdonense]